MAVRVFDADKCPCLFFSGKVVDHIQKTKYEDVPLCAVYEDNPQQVIDDILCYQHMDLPQHHITDSLCTCYWFCDEVLYDVRKSESIWPRVNTMASFLQTYVKEHPGHLASRVYQKLQDSGAMRVNTIDPNKEILYSSDTLPFPSKEEIFWVYNNFFRLNVFLRDMVVVEHLQEPAFRLVDFCSNIGGVFGLWGGVSLLTLFEVFTFFSHLFFYFCCREPMVI